MKKTPTYLMVPGLRGHVRDHWQTLLQAELPGAHSVPPLEHDKLSRRARVAALEAALARIQGPVVLVAHSAGVAITAHWAQQHPESAHRIQAALLATPADLEAPLPAGYPTVDALQAGGWLPLPRQRLPFPSIVAASRNDPLARYARVEALAQSWGSRLVDLGEVGHLNPAAGFGPWPHAHVLLAWLKPPQNVE